jgi:hypothetical protein
MSEPENFLSRWSRRKRRAAEEPQTDERPLPDRARESGDAEPRNMEATTPALPETLDSRVRGNERGEDSEQGKKPAFDLSKLPSLETITAETDIRVFLQKGVPADLTRAALRRAWSADPNIRDFIGIAENQYDFATGSDLPGFGPLQSTDDIRKMVAELFGESPKVDAGLDQKAHDGRPETSANTDPSEPAQEAKAPSAGQDVASVNQDQRSATEPPQQSAGSIVRRDKVDIAMQQSNQDSEYGVPPTRRPHGRALPQ